MEQKLISNKASWSFQEILPILIAIGLGIGGIFLGITETFTINGAIITAVVGFGLALYVFTISSRRKWKSTLFAELSYDKNYNVSVWMRKPIEDKWTGKLDKGKNTGRLSRIDSIKLETIRGTRVLNISTLDKKPIYIPTRFLNNDEMKNYLAAAVAESKGKIKFDSKEQATEFAKLIAGAKAVNRDTDIGTVDPTLEEKRKTLPAAEEKLIVDSEKEHVPAKPVKKLGYGQYKKAGTKETIAQAVSDANTKLDAETAEEEVKGVNDLLGINTEKTTSLKIETDK